MDEYKFCFYCKIKIKFDSQYLKHMKECRLKQSPRITKTEEKSQSQQETRFEIDKSSIYCTLCSHLSFDDIDSYNQHVKNEHHTLPTDNHELFKCHLCFQSFIHFPIFQDHIKIHCKNVLDLQEEADDRGKIENLFRVLENSIKSTTSSDEFSKKVFIDCCSEFIRNKQSSVGIDFTARQTDNQVILNDNLETSPQSVVSMIQSNADRNQQKSFPCEICQKVFKKSNDLLRHKRVHSNERPFKCRQCSKSFKLKCVLESHLRRHTKNVRKPIFSPLNNDRVFKSGESHPLNKQASNGFDDIDIDNLFQMSTSDDKNDNFFNDSNESDDFESNNEVNNYEKLKCNLCDRLFICQEDLSNHILKKHSEKCNDCSYCEKRFTKPSQLKRHLLVRSKIFN